jgi:hypothetical protein
MFDPIATGFAQGDPVAGQQADQLASVGLFSK